MDRLHEIAQLLVSSWVLGSDAESDKAIPTSHGVLDVAIRALTTRTEFPAWAKEELHFADSRIGMQCVELPAILDWAQLADLTSVPNPWYQVTEVQVTKPTARKLLKRLRGVSEEQAAALGKLLRVELENAKATVLHPVEHAV